METRYIHGYTVLFEQAPDGGWGADAPDLPGLGVAGQHTLAEAERLMWQAVRLHLDGLQEDGPPVPPPKAAHRAPVALI